MIKHISCYVLCIVLMLAWSFNVYAEDEVKIFFDILNDSEINLSVDKATLTITASTTSVTDFDIYVNKEFYKNLEGSIVKIDLKKLNKLGSVYLEAYANGADGVLAQNGISLTLKDGIKDYIYQSDMTGLVEGVWPTGSAGDCKGGYMKPVEIDEDYGVSMALGSTPQLPTSEIVFGAKTNAGITDVTKAVFECDIRYTGDLQEAYLGTPQFNTGLTYTIGINMNTKVNGSALTPDEWHHVKWTMDLDADTYSFTIDGYTVSPLNEPAVSTYSYFTGYTRFTIVPQSSKNLEFLIDNIEYYDPTGTKPASEIIGVADSDGNSVVASNSQYVKVTLTDGFGEVTADNIKLVNTNGEQAIEKVTVNDGNSKELYIYPKGGFISADEYYLTIKKDTALADDKLSKDTCYKFNTLAKDIDFNGGVVVKKAGKVNYTFKLTNKTTDPQTVCLLMYTNVNDTFTSLKTQDIEVPAGAENVPYSIPAEDMVEGAVGYGLVVTNIDDLRLVSNKLIVSKSN